MGRAATGKLFVQATQVEAERAGDVIGQVEIYVIKCKWVGIKEVEVGTV